MAMELVLHAEKKKTIFKGMCYCVLYLYNFLQSNRKSSKDSSAKPKIQREQTKNPDMMASSTTSSNRKIASRRSYDPDEDDATQLATNK